MLITIYNSDRHFRSNCLFLPGVEPGDIHKLTIYLFTSRYAGRLKAKKREMVIESEFHHKEKVRFIEAYFNICSKVLIESLCCSTVITKKFLARQDETIQ